MSERVTVDHTPDGRLVAIKRSRSADDAERLRREATILERARHPGVVELVDLYETERGAELLTLAVGEGSLARRGHQPVPRVAALAASLAATLADLHAMGIVHGRVEASHVLVAQDGRPLLCGMAEASLPDDEGRSGASPPADLAGLGRLVLDLLAPDTELEPIPELRRRLRRPRRQGWTGYQRRALLTLADQASADEPTHRPTARAFAAALSAAFPDAALRDVANGDDDDGTCGTDRGVDAAALADEGVPIVVAVAPEPAGAERVILHPPDPGGLEHDAHPLSDRRGKALLMAASAVIVGVLGVSALAVGAASLRGGQRPEVLASPHAGAAPGPDDAATSTSTSTSTSPATSSTAARAAPPAAGRADPAAECEQTDGHVADLDGDGCREALSVEGTVVSTDAGRFQVGEDGDEVVLGDWDCDGSSTPALFRPDTGDVFAFERWASQDDEVSTVALDQVDEGTGIRVERVDGCDRLVITTPGDETTISVDGDVAGGAS